MVKNGLERILQQHYMAVISRKISKEWFRLSEQYMGLDRLYDYYTEMIADYKTGKEIRTYQEQLIIEKDATQQLLNEGIAIQKKIAANSAKSSSLIAIIGAVIGFAAGAAMAVKEKLDEQSAQEEQNKRLHEQTMGGL